MIHYDEELNSIKEYVQLLWNGDNLDYFIEHAFFNGIKNEVIDNIYISDVIQNYNINNDKFIALLLLDSMNYNDNFNQSIYENFINDNFLELKNTYNILPKNWNEIINNDIEDNAFIINSCHDHAFNGTKITSRQVTPLNIQINFNSTLYAFKKLKTNPSYHLYRSIFLHASDVASLNQKEILIEDLNKTLQTIENNNIVDLQEMFNLFQSDIAKKIWSKNITNNNQKMKL